MQDLQSLKVIDLLRLYAAILRELKTRGIVRTRNNPVADYAEWLVKETLRFSLESNSKAGYDAVGPDGLRYQIKSRRFAFGIKSVQLGAIRNLEDRPFDYLIAIIFGEEFLIRYAAKIPYDIVLKRSRYRRHINAHVLHFRRTIFDEAGVEDITDVLSG